MEGGSMNEILALNNEKYARKFMNQTDKITKILINHQDWIKNESVFWQWMVNRKIFFFLKIKRELCRFQFCIQQKRKKK